MMHSPDRSPRVLAFAEDPGAANAIAPTVALLRRRGVHVTFLTLAGAARRARELDVEHECLSTDPAPQATFERLTPDLLVVGTSDRIDTPAHDFVRLARQFSRPSIGVVDGQAASGHRFRGPGNHPLSHAPDLIAVPDDVAAARYQSLGLAKQRIAVVGNPHYDRVIETADRLNNQPRDGLRRNLSLPDDGRPLIVFATEISKSRGYADHSPGPDDTFVSTGGRTLRTHICLENFLHAIGAMAQRPALVLRLHPKTPADEFAWAASEFDRLSDSGDPLALVASADMVVGLTTILLEESALIGTPALAMIRRAEERDWLMGVRDGWVSMATDPSSLPQTILATLALPREDVRARARAGVSSGATERLTDLVVSCLTQEPARL